VIWSAIFQRAIIGCVITGLIMGLISVFVIRMRLTAIGYSMSHSAFAGAALGVALSMDPLITAIFFSAITATLIGPVSDKARVSIDTITSIAFSLNMALAFIFLTLSPQVGLSSEVASVIWGSIIAITNSDLIYLEILFLATLSLIYLFWKELFAIMFDRKMAEADGISTKPFIYFVIFLTGIVVAISLKLVGGILIYALLFNPASSALQFLHDIKKVMILSPIIGMASCLTGFFASFMFNMPVGACIALFSTIIFSISVILSPKRKRRVIV